MIEKQYIIGKFFDLLQNEMKTNEKLFNEMQTTNLFLGKIPIQYIMNNTTEKSFLFYNWKAQKESNSQRTTYSLYSGEISNASC